MVKYRGQYRVVYEMDIKAHKPYELSFIPCRVKKGTNIYRNSDTELLVYIPSIIIGNKILKGSPDLFCLFLQSDCEIILCFDESRIDEVVSILRPWATGKNTPPGSKKNIKFQDIGLRLNQHK